MPPKWPIMAEISIKMCFPGFLSIDKQKSFKSQQFESNFKFFRFWMAESQNSRFFILFFIQVLNKCISREFPVSREMRPKISRFPGNEKDGKSINSSVSFISFGFMKVKIFQCWLLTHKMRLMQPSSVRSRSIWTAIGNARPSLVFPVVFCFSLSCIKQFTLRFWILIQGTKV